MILDNIKPTIQSQQTSIMRHPTDVASDVTANLSSLRTKTNMNLHAPDRFVFFPRRHILTNKTPQRNVVHAKRNKPTPQVILLQYAPMCGCRIRTFVQEFSYANSHSCVLTTCWLLGSIKFTGNLCRPQLNI